MQPSSRLPSARKYSSNTTPLGTPTGRPSTARRMSSFGGRFSTRRSSVDDMAPTPNWFLCHHRAGAKSHAESMSTWIYNALHEDSFVNLEGADDSVAEAVFKTLDKDGDGKLSSEELLEAATAAEFDGLMPETGPKVADLGPILREVKRSKALVFFLTKNAETRPWVLLEIFWACNSNIPLIPLHVVGGGYEYATGRAHFADLRKALEELNPGAVQHIEEVLEPHGYTFDELAETLKGTVPHLISLSYNPYASATRMMALLQDMEGRIRSAAAASVQAASKKEPAKDFEFRPARASTVSVSVEVADDADDADDGAAALRAPRNLPPPPSSAASLPPPQNMPQPPPPVAAIDVPPKVQSPNQLDDVVHDVSDRLKKMFTKDQAELQA